MKLPSVDSVLFTAQGDYDNLNNMAHQNSADMINQTINGEGRCFFDINEWKDYIMCGEFTFAFGTRFHGNIMALNSHVPTLWIVHDMRTYELVQYLHLPYVFYSDVIREKYHIGDLIDRCDYAEAEKHYPSLLAKYRNFCHLNFNMEIQET